MINKISRMFNKPIIEFITYVPGLSLIEECQPKPSIKYIPQWWKDKKHIPPHINANEKYEGNIKNCPSFPDWFSQGYIIPMWADVLLSVNWKENNWSWKIQSAEFFEGVGMNPEKSLNELPYKLKGDRPSFDFKVMTPWHIMTKSKYSCMFIPLFFHENEDFSVLPGIIDTDNHHNVNLDVMYHSEKTEIFIKRGTPFVQVIPYKREKKKFLIKEEYNLKTKQLNKLNKHLANIGTKVPGSQLYVKARKNEK